MKKLFALIAVLTLFPLGVTNYLRAEEPIENDSSTQVVDTAGISSVDVGTVSNDEGETDKVTKSKPIHQVVKEKFIEGGASFMGFVLICLILGLALAIERIIYLNLASTNTDKLLEKIENAMSSGGIEAAKEVCRNTRGPVASIFYQGIDRADLGIEAVEKSVISYGNVQMGLLEKNMSWIALFIAVAPMLGFMGTVIGMIDAFDKIQLAGEARPDEVAEGIKVALITTVSGLIVAIILQVFYNYLLAKIDGIVNKMEDASISLIDLLVKNKVK